MTYPYGDPHQRQQYRHAFGQPQYPCNGQNYRVGVNERILSSAVAGVIALYGLIGVVLTVTVLAELSESSEAIAMCERQIGRSGGSPESCGANSFATGWFYVSMFTVASLGALAGAILLCLLKKLAGWVITVSGATLTSFSILFLAELSDLTRVVFMVIFGSLISIAGVCCLIPATAKFLGLGGPRRPGTGFNGPSGGGPGWQPPLIVTPPPSVFAAPPSDAPPQPPL